MRISLLVLCLSFFITAYAQEKIKSLSLIDSIFATAIDRPGDFYVITKSGQIQRFDKDGKLSLLYKSEQMPTLFDPRDGARLFIYYRDQQQYAFLNPSFERTTSYKIDSAFAIQPWLICPSGEYKLWVLDSVDNSLKKINVKAPAVEVEVVVDQSMIDHTTAFTAMREYQNFVFLLHPVKGIFVFNSLGHHIKTIDASGIQQFNFLGEELYYLQGDTIHLFNLFTTDTRQIKIATGYIEALLTDERMILFHALAIDIFAFRP